VDFVEGLAFDAAHESGVVGVVGVLLAESGEGGGGVGGLAGTEVPLVVRLGTLHQLLLLERGGWRNGPVVLVWVSGVESGKLIVEINLLVDG